MPDIGVVTLKLVRVGGSLRVAIPARFVRAVGLAQGDRVRVAFCGDVLALTPIDSAAEPGKILSAISSSGPQVPTALAGSG